MTMPTAAGPISKALTGFADAMVASGQLQAYTGESSDDDAEGHIYFNIVPLDSSANETEALATLQARRPIIVLWPDPTETLVLQMEAQGSHPNPGGLINVYLEADTSKASTDEPTIDANDDAELMRWWHNSVGQLLRDSFAKAKNAGHLNVITFGPMQTWRNPRTHRPQMGDYHAAIGDIKWGVSL